jgi:hypothetical protein
VEAGPAEALLGRVEDVLAPGALDIWLELGHRRPSVPAGLPWFSWSRSHREVHRTK